MISSEIGKPHVSIYFLKAFISHQTTLAPRQRVSARRYAQMKAVDEDV